MHVPGSNLVLHIYHLTSPSHRRAAKERKREYDSQFAAHKEENSARVLRMSELRGQPSPDDFLYDSTWGTGSASRARSLGVSRPGSSRPVSMLWDTTSAYGYTAGPERAASPSSYLSGDSSDSSIDGVMGRDLSDAEGNGSVGLPESAGLDLPPPHEFADGAMGTAPIRKRARPLSWFGGMELSDRRPFNVGRSRGGADRRELGILGEELVRDGEQVGNGRGGAGEVTMMGAIVA